MVGLRVMGCCLVLSSLLTHQSDKVGKIFMVWGMMTVFVVLMVFLPPIIGRWRS